MVLRQPLKFMDGALEALNPTPLQQLGWVHTAVFVVTAVIAIPIIVETECVVVLAAGVGAVVAAAVNAILD